MSELKISVRFSNIMKYLVAYDISDDQVRAKVSRLLLKYGYRIQYSVFYLPKVTEGDIRFLERKIRSLVNPRSDIVCFYPVEKIDAFEGYPIEPWEVIVI